VRRIVQSLLCGILLVVPAFLYTPAFAGNGTSLYSRLGLGDLHPGSNVRSAGMGYSGIAFASSTTINSLAPATWSKIDRARIEAGMLYEGYNSSDATSSRYLSRADFNGATLALPISTSNGIVAVFGFTPFSTVDYTAFSTERYVTGVDTMSGTITYKGSGGISRGQIGGSYSPLSNLSVGFSVNYLFGTIDHLTTVSAAEEGYAPSTVTRGNSLHGLTFSLGGLYEGIGTGILQPLSLGFVVTTGTTLSTTQQVFYQYSDQSDTSTESTGTASVPMTLGVGLSYRASERWVCSADYTTQNWGDATFDGQTSSYLRTRSDIGIGVERLPAKELPGTPFLDRMAYRLGLFYHSTYITLNNEMINAWGVTFGVGIPVTNEARLHLAIEYGSRGTTANALIKDSILRLSASVTLSELWFARFEEE
jgi:hypothetical protein